MRIELSASTALCTLLLACSVLGCARSAIPRLDAEFLTAPALQGLMPRALDVRVSDKRPVSEEERRATEQHLTDVLARVFATRGVTVDEGASARWFVIVQQPVSKTDAMNPESCVEVQSELAVMGVSSPASRTTRCSQWRQGATSFGSGVLAFEGAVDGVLRRLDDQLRDVLERFAPPTFDPARIDTPSLAWLWPRELSLTVRDELSAGVSGESLKRALDDAFERSGIRRVADADYRLEWVVRRPARAEGAPTKACVELSVDARHERDGFRLTSVTCSGWNDRLVTDVLRRLNTHGEKRSRRSPRPKKPAPPIRADAPASPGERAYARHQRSASTVPTESSQTFG
jgi:hypothetical protein